jgi:lactoylglutathione lyase
LAKAIHTMIRVMNAERSVDFYQKAFGLKPVHVLDYETFKLTYLRNDENDFEVELTENKGRSEAYEQGNAYGHLAVCVDELAAEHERLSSLGVTLGDIKAMNYHGELVARFFFVTNTRSKCWSVTGITGSWTRFQTTTPGDNHGASDSFFASKTHPTGIHPGQRGRIGRFIFRCAHEFV